MGHLLVGGLGQPVPGGDHHIGEEVELSDQQAPDRATHQMGHDLHVRGADRPGPGVGQHQSVEGFWVLLHGRQPDGDAPVMGHQRYPAQGEIVDESGDHLVVLGRQIPVPGAADDSLNPG